MIAWYSAARRFVRARSLVYQMGTHMAQRNLEEVKMEAMDYMNSVHRIMEGVTVIGDSF